MAFEEEILLPPFQEEGEEGVDGEPDPLEDDELEGDDDAKESDIDEEADDDLGIEEETE